MKTAGLTRQRWLDPIEDFVRKHGRLTPRWAVICTFQCELDLLERRVVPALSRRGRQFRTLVLADAGALESTTNRAPRGAVNIHAVRLKNRSVFHPKLVLLRAGAEARLCFGSANLTTGGMGSNLELWTHSDQPNIVSAAADFLSKLSETSGVQTDPACTRQLRRALLGLNAAPSEDFWSSLEGSFSRRVPKEEAHLAIVSPAYASVAGAASARRLFPQKTAMLYTDGALSVTGTTTRIYEQVSLADRDEDAEPQPTTLHAKAYLFCGDAKTTAWVGSANFTAQALTRSVTAGGNVECLVRTEMTRRETDALVEELEAFTRPIAKGELLTRRPETSMFARSNIIGCELSPRGDRLRLTLYVVEGVPSVTIEHGKHRAVVKVSARRGVLEGEELRTKLPHLSLTGPCVLLLHEIVGKERIALLINVPFVPDPADDSSGEAELDSLLLELLGHVPSGPVDEETNEVVEDDDLDDDPIEDALIADVDGVLDQCRHEGLLDRLAVKATQVKRIIMATTKPGSLRDEQLEEAWRACAKACPTALRPTLQDWFAR